MRQASHDLYQSLLSNLLVRVSLCCVFKASPIIGMKGVYTNPKLVVCTGIYRTKYPIIIIRFKFSIFFCMKYTLKKILL